jgi:hypothetical protein
MEQQRKRRARVKGDSALQREKSDRRPADAARERDTNHDARSQAAEIHG